MSSAREIDQKDFDLEQMVKIIDSALESNDPRIKDALRSLMTITVLCTAEHPDQVMRYGPLARLIEDMRNLNNRTNRIEAELQNLASRIPPPRAEPYTPVGPYPGTGNPWTGTGSGSTRR